ncbi:MAG TPA: NAD-dependent epimerase/dehydratase family protein [Actinomycetota bacterium]|nr:NAD-dependent epimerase/dehydratase family protein [Actinomycetota bacterium]
MGNVEGLTTGARADWSGRRVLITGATGMLGSWLTRRLVDLDAYVVTLVRDPDPQSELLRSGTVNRVSVVSGCLEEFDAVERAINMHEVDTVFHLGAQTIAPAAHRSPRATFESNVQGTWNLLEACRIHAAMVERVVVASSDKAYGFNQELPYREEMALLAGHPYEVSKTCVDLISQSYHLSYGLPVAVTRCCNIYGGGDLNWSRLVPGTIRSLLTSRRPVIRSDGSFVREYMYVQDAVDAYLALAGLAGKPEVAGQAFNFGTEEPLTVRELYGAVCEAVGGGYVEPAVLNRAKDEIMDQRLSTAKARRLLGWSPNHGLIDGLRQTLDWYRGYLSNLG